MSTLAAKKCFEENIRLFGNAQTNPEKFNLYTGLFNLANAIQNLERKIDTIEQNLSYVQANMR